MYHATAIPTLSVSRSEQLTELAMFVLQHPPARIEAERFYRERKRFLGVWFSALPDLPEEEVEGTVHAVLSLATFFRGGRS